MFIGDGATLAGDFVGTDVEQTWKTFRDNFSVSIREALNCASAKGTGGLRKLYLSSLSETSTSFEDLYCSQTCIVCLSALPVHQLPCSHAFCEQCLQAWSMESKNEIILKVAHCPLCQARWPPESRPWQKILKPSTAGCRILALDGGGIRGIAQLVVLKALEVQLDLGIPLARYFDVIVGTGLGKSLEPTMHIFPVPR